MPCTTVRAGIHVDRCYLRVEDPCTVHGVHMWTKWYCDEVLTLRHRKVESARTVEPRATWRDEVPAFVALLP